MPRNLDFADNAILHFMDGALVDIKDGVWCQRGCPTCDWGSIYAKELDFVLTQKTIHIEATQMYDYPELSIGEIVRLLADIDTDGMTEFGFCSEVELKFREWATDHHYDLDIEIKNN